MNIPIYRYLYDWKTANSLCLIGWHLPIDDEWNLLESGIELPVNESNLSNQREQHREKLEDLVLNYKWLAGVILKTNHITT